MSGIAGNDGATCGSRAAPRSRGRYGAAALLIAATLSLTQGTACAQNILGIISGLARYHSEYLFGRSRSMSIDRRTTGLLMLTNRTRTDRKGVDLLEATVAVQI